MQYFVRILLSRRTLIACTVEMHLLFLVCDSKYADLGKE
jgi:hypothetical protein